MSNTEKQAYTYKLVSKDPSITDCYVGSTTNLRHRKFNHKGRCNDPKREQHHYKVYQFIREHGGWDNWEMVMIESFPFINRDDQRKHERKAFDELKPTLNCDVPCRTVKEWCEDNRDSLLAKKREYHHANRGEILVKKREYREANRKQIAAKGREYRKANKQAISIRTSEKIQCECGSTLTRHCIPRHRRTKKHMDLMATLTPPTES